MSSIRGSSLFVGIFLAIFAGYPLYSMLTGPHPTPGALLGMVLAIFCVGLFLVYRGVAPALAAGRFGVPRITVTPKQARTGDELKVVVSLAPKRHVDVEKVTIELIARSVVVTHDVSGRSTESSSECYEDTKDLDGAKVLAGKKKRFVAAFPIKHVYAAVGGHLRWSIRVHVAYAGFPDWEAEIPVNVVV